MGRALGVRRIVAAVLVMGATGAGLVVTAGSAGAGVRPPPNCTIPRDGTPMPEPAPAAEPGAIIVEPPPGPEPSVCATVKVTKVVNGTAPQGTIFRVLVQCDPLPRLPRLQADLPPGQLSPFTTVLEFPATGGTQEVLIGNPSSCTFSETPPPGCELASINPTTVQITQLNTQVVVINDCEPPAAAPVNIQGTIVVNQPPAPTPVVVATPRFTG